MKLLLPLAALVAALTTSTAWAQGADPAVEEPASEAVTGAISVDGVVVTDGSPASATIDEPTSVTLSFDDNGAQVTVSGPRGEVVELTGDEQILQRLDAIETRLDAVEGRIDDASVRIDETRDAVDEELVPSAVAWSGSVDIPEEEIVSDAVSYTGPVLVRGVVKGDAVSMVADVRIASTGVVYGDAVSFGGNVIVEDGGQVRGDRVALGRHGSAVRSVVAPPMIDEGGPFGLLNDLARRIALLLSFAGVGVLVVGFWPNQVDQVAWLVVERPFWYSVAGMILSAMLALAAMVLTFTVVGIPIAMLLAVLLGLGWILGFVGVCKAVGERFAITRDRGAWAAFLAGAALLMAVGLIPWIGTLAIVMIGFPAVGAALVSRFGNRRDPDAT